MGERCAKCDRPEPTDADYARPDVAPGDELLCWGGDCYLHAIDWRARARSSEKRAEAAEAELTTARELVAVLEERAEALSAEVADREERIEATRAQLRKLRSDAVACAAAWVRALPPDEETRDVVPRSIVVDAAMRLREAADAATLGSSFVGQVGSDGKAGGA